MNSRSSRGVGESRSPEDDDPHRPATRERTRTDRIRVAALRETRARFARHSPVVGAECALEGRVRGTLRRVAVAGDRRRDAARGAVAGGLRPLRRGSRRAPAAAPRGARARAIHGIPHTCERRPDWRPPTWSPSSSVFVAAPILPFLGDWPSRRAASAKAAVASVFRPSARAWNVRRALSGRPRSRVPRVRSECRAARSPRPPPDRSRDCRRSSPRRGGRCRRGRRGRWWVPACRRR